MAKLFVVFEIVYDSTGVGTVRNDEVSDWYEPTNLEEVRSTERILARRHKLDERLYTVVLTSWRLFLAHDEEYL